MLFSNFAVLSRGVATVRSTLYEQYSETTTITTAGHPKLAIAAVSLIVVCGALPSLSATP
jgi:hypothetical protein